MVLNKSDASNVILTSISIGNIALQKETIKGGNNGTILETEFKVNQTSDILLGILVRLEMNDDGNEEYIIMDKFVEPISKNYILVIIIIVSILALLIIVFIIVLIVFKKIKKNKNIDIEGKKDPINNELNININN